MAAKFTLTGNASGAVKQIRDLNKELDKTEQAFDKGSKSAANLERAAQRIVRQTEGPFEKWNRKLRETDDLLKRGKLTTEQAARATEFYTRKLREAGQQAEMSFGTQALQSLRSYVMGLGSITGAVAAIQQALSTLNQEAEAAMQRHISSQKARGQAAQIATSTENYEALVRRGQQMVSQGIFTPEREGQAIMTAVAFQNAGLSAATQDYVQRLAQARIISPDQLATFPGALAKAKGAFPGQDVPQLANRLVVGAQDSQTQATAFTLALVNASQAARAIGVTGAEQAAALQTVESGAPTVKEASTQLKAYYNVLSRRGLTAGPLMERAQALQTWVGDRPLIEALGSSEAAAAHTLIMAESERYQRALGKVRGAGDVISERMGYVEGDPTFRATQQFLQARGMKAMAEGPIGTQRLITDAAQQQVRRWRDERYPRAYGALEDAWINFRQFFGDEAGVQRDLRDHPGVSPELRGLMEEPRGPRGTRGGAGGAFIEGFLQGIEGNTRETAERMRQQNEPTTRQE